jgi:outer membrane protein OmpA-like peptidoglycan-associated protein
MKKLLFIPLIVTATLSLLGCASPDQGIGFRSSEAGSEIASDGFGIANANNIGVQNGDLTNTMVANLTRKFAAEVPAKVNFAFNSAVLDATARNALQQQARWIKAHDKIKFRVYGHTDKVGSANYNRRLGLRRARAVVNFLVSQGVSRSKVQAVASFGETRPLVLTESRSRENRRTVTEVSGFVKRGHGPDLDGKYAMTVYKTYISTPYKLNSIPRFVDAQK